MLPIMVGFGSDTILERNPFSYHSSVYIVKYLGLHPHGLTAFPSSHYQFSISGINCHSEFIPMT